MKKTIKKVIAHPLFSGSAIMIIGLNSASALNSVYHLIVGRMLGPVLYGELAAMISVIGLLSILPSAISLVIIKQVSSAKSDDQVNLLIKWFKNKFLVMSLIFSLLVLILSPFIYSFLYIHNFSYLILISLFSFFSLLSGLNRALLQGLLKFKEVVVSITAENTVKLVLSVVLIYISSKVEGAMFAYLIAGFTGWYITHLFLKIKKVKLLNFTPDIKGMIRFTIPVIVQTIAITSLYTTDLILVKHYFTSHEAGIYAALSTVGKIIFFATGPISAVMFPLVSKRKSKGESYKRIFIYSFGATGLFVIMSTLIYWIFPNFIIGLLYGKEYLEASKLLVWFALFIALFTLSALLISYNLSIGKTKVSVISLIAAFSQIFMISLFHNTLFEVILSSICVTALLLVVLLIYSSYGYKVNFNNSSRI